MFLCFYILIYLTFGKRWKLPLFINICVLYRVCNIHLIPTPCLSISMSFPTDPPPRTLSRPPSLLDFPCSFVRKNIFDLWKCILIIIRKLRARMLTIRFRTNSNFPILHLYTILVYLF